LQTVTFAKSFNVDRLNFANSLSDFQSCIILIEIIFTGSPTVSAKSVLAKIVSTKNQFGENRFGEKPIQRKPFQRKNLSFYFV
jgi:hypothetical protein